MPVRHSDAMYQSRRTSLVRRGGWPSWALSVARIPSHIVARRAALRARSAAMTIAAGRVALVTGGAAGLGLAITRRLVGGGVRVVVVDVSTGALDAVQTDLGAAVVGVEADVRSGDALAAAVAT